MVSGAHDNTIRVWELAGANSTRILEGHTAFVRSVIILPDGRHVVSSSDDSTVRVWDLSDAA